MRQTQLRRTLPVTLKNQALDNRPINEDINQDNCSVISNVENAYAYAIEGRKATRLGKHKFRQLFRRTFKTYLLFKKYGGFGNYSEWINYRQPTAYSLRSIYRSPDMNKFILFAAIAVLAMPASITRAYDMWTNPPKASCTFTFKYEGDALPTDNAYTNLGFTFIGTNANWNSIATNGNVKYLLLDKTQPGNNYYVISNGPAWQPKAAGPFTVEIRARVVTETYGFHLYMDDANDRNQASIYDDNFHMYTVTFTGQTNNDTFHTFRIANYSYNDSAAGQSNVVWRDGVFLGSIDGNTGTTGDGIRLLFGDIAGAGAPSRFWVDYLRWTTNGAYPWKANPPAGTVISVY